MKFKLSLPDIPKLYETEAIRHNISPRQFFTYCKKRMAAAGYDIEMWTTYENWIQPLQEVPPTRNDHEDWEEPLREFTKQLPYNMQYYLQRNYNFILEFDFWDDNSGDGYFYALEYKR